MRWLRWFPWKFVIRRLALSQGFLDPTLLLARLARFGQPSEVAAPTELLRASALLHARGLINSQVIQYNLDWVWPYWIARQFDPRDHSFIPRAFSLTHINLTHRNWTAIGLPDISEFPIVDPRGLVTPWFDGWSLDGWIIAEGWPPLIPARAAAASQTLIMDDHLAVVTRTESEGLRLDASASVRLVSEVPTCRLEFTARAETNAWLVIALRPYNPEGISFIHEIDLIEGGKGWIVNGQPQVMFGMTPDAVRFSHFKIGDVYQRLREPPSEDARVSCPVGLASAAALFALHPSKAREVFVDVPLAATAPKRPSRARPSAPRRAGEWRRAVEGSCRLRIPDARWQFLYDAALYSLVLHTPGDIYPGPYTYKRFWFRDAALIIQALVCAGLGRRAEHALDLFPKRQTLAGYCLSQEGEWDSNGEALWAMERFCTITGCRPKPEWKNMIDRAAGWIRRKRLAGRPESPHAGLFPPGYSAEHLGPSDYYYWDDFWGVAGLHAAARLAKAYGDARGAADLQEQADDFLRCIERSLSTAAARLGHAAMPASPYRRMDPGAIGSLAAGYPLQLLPADDWRLIATVEYLLTQCFFQGGFFQDMSHSGINPYLTLHVAQVLLRAGDARYAEVMQRVAELASPTGQWPEAIHPWTGGGCMGDGQHIWAAAEWLLMLRNCLVREEGGRLILGSGIVPAWLAQETPIVFGPAPTAFGAISLQLEPHPRRPVLQWRGAWHGHPPPLEIRVPGCRPITPSADDHTVTLERTVPAGG